MCAVDSPGQEADRTHSEFRILDFVCQVTVNCPQCAQSTAQARKSTVHTALRVDLGVNTLTLQYTRLTGHTVFSDLFQVSVSEIMIVCGAH